MIALSWPGPVEMIFLFLLLAVPAAIVLILLRARTPGRRQEGFPVVPTAELDGPGTYRVVGIDKTTRADREVTLEAASRANAHVKAELDGIVVTSVTKT